MYKDEIVDFREHLNLQNADIQFAKKIEDGKIPLLDWKPTHTDGLPHESSYETRKDFISHFLKHDIEI